MEKLKDILYDMSDVIISLFIIAVIFAVVSWKLNDAMPLDSTFFAAEETTTETTALSTESTVDIVMTEATSETDQSDQQTTVATTIAPTTAAAVVNKTITIRSGSSGNAIAKQLQQAGIIADSKEFLKVVDKLGVATRLQVGTFTLSSNMSYEEIARILSGK